MDPQLKSIVDRARELVAEREADMDTLISGQEHPRNKQEAMGVLFRERVPERYVECRPDNVPQLAGILAQRLDTGVFFQGPPGTGKTYAATALAWLYISARMEPWRHHEYGYPFYPVKTLMWVTSPYLLYRIRATFNQRARETSQAVIDEVSMAHVLVLDDLGAEKTTDHAADVMYTILSERINHCRFTIVTTNMTFADIEAWKPQIASRLAAMHRLDLPDVDRRISK